MITRIEKRIDRKEPIEGGVKWYFEFDPKTELLDKCRQFLDEMENFVSKIQSAFP